MAAATSKPQTEILAQVPADTYYRKLDTIAAATSYYPLTFAGIDVDTGYLKKFLGDDSTIWFDGVLDMDNVVTLDAAAAGVEELRVTKAQLLRVVVAAGGVLVTDVYKPVYAVSGNDYQVSLTPPASGFTEPIGFIEEYVSATEVVIKPRYKKQPSLGAGSISILSIPVDLASVAAGDVVTNFTPGFTGKVRSYSFVANKPATTAAKLATFNLEIGTTDLTGGVLALTTALATPQGKVTAATAITAGNTFGPTDTISVEASSVTAFVEGTGTLLIVLEVSPNN